MTKPETVISLQHSSYSIQTACFYLSLHFVFPHKCFSMHSPPFTKISVLQCLPSSFIKMEMKEWIMKNFNTNFFFPCPQMKWLLLQTCSSLRCQIKKSFWPGPAQPVRSQVTGSPSSLLMSLVLCRGRWLCLSVKTPTLKCHTYSLEHCTASTSTPFTMERKVYRLLGSKLQVRMTDGFLQVDFLATVTLTETSSCVESWKAI